MTQTPQSFNKADASPLALIIALLALCPMHPAAAQTSITTHVLSAGITNGVYNASTCETAAAPSWCQGSDVGEWINSAIRDGQKNDPRNPVHVILDPYKTYTQTTTIKKPLNAGIDGQGSRLIYKPLTGAALISGISTDPQSNNFINQQPLENIRLASTQSGNTAMASTLAVTRRAR